MTEESAGWAERLVGVQTAADLAQALDVVRRRAGLSHRAVEVAAARLPRTPRLASTVSRTTSSVLCTKGTCALETLKTFLTVCDVPEGEWAGWVRAWERARGVGAARPDGVIRVKDADPRWLGVHRPIEVVGARGDLPAYVARDIDVATGGIRASLSVAAERGGFVVLVGKSSVGKTRSLYQAVLDLVPDWWLLHPDRAEHLDALDGRHLERVVIWLDDLQRFLGGGDGLSGGSVRRLLQGGQVVVVGTLWPTHYLRYTGVTAPDDAGNWTVERDLLAMAQVVRVPEYLSETELDRARDLARTDVRLRVALDVADIELIQVIAAAPQLMECWQDADGYARALLTAAADIALLGVRSPLPLNLLRAVAPAYCRDRERAVADRRWFDIALTYATTELHGVMSLLTPVPLPAGVMGQIAGYMVADYLLQQIAVERSVAAIPVELWTACLDHIADPADLTRLGESAESRQVYEWAAHFYRRAAATEPLAAYRLSRLLAAQGHDDEALEILLPLAVTPDTRAAELTATLLRRTGREDQLRFRVNNGDSTAAAELVNLLVSMGRERELLTYTGPGNKAIAYHLADHLAGQGRIDEAAEVLQPHASLGDWPAANQQAELLIAADRVNEALDVLRNYADQGHHLAASRLVVLLTRLGHEHELQARADAGDWPAAVQLADLLVSTGRTAELEARADAGDRPAAYRLAHLLLKEGREAELHARADKGDKPALYQLADLLAATNRHDQAIQLLRPHAEDGDESAASRLINLFGHGEGE